MEDRLIARIQQIRAAFGASTEIYSTDQIEVEQVGEGLVFTFNPNADNKKEELAHQVSGILAAIGSIKDYLDAWCKANGRPIIGDSVINSNLEVAIVHDLWNLDKHAVLDRKPRSGFVPRLGDLERALRLAEAENPEEWISVDLLTGETTNGKAQVILTASVYNGEGKFVGDFRDICEKAVSIWRDALIKAGVAL